MAIGAALGLLFGAMLLPNASLGGLAGVVIGLLIGAILDLQSRKRGGMDQ